MHELSETFWLIYSEPLTGVTRVLVSGASQHATCSLLTAAAVRSLQGSHESMPPPVVLLLTLLRHDVSVSRSWRESCAGGGHSQDSGPARAVQSELHSEGARSCWAGRSTKLHQCPLQEQRPDQHDVSQSAQRMDPPLQPSPAC